jgi:hopanoid biosynthesis associated protein HpnK
VKRLIVTADDFGAAPEVNDAVIAAHRDGILTSASLMVSAPAAADAAARAHLLPSLRVGLHLVLVEGRPVLPASAVSELLGPDGRFRTDLPTLGAAIAFSARARRQLASEISAQFEAFRATGLALDHCNAHQHFHLHPVVGALLLDIGRRFGLRAVRAPLEPARLLRHIEPHTSPAAALLTAPFALLLRRRSRAAGMLCPDHVFGLRWSGALHRDRLDGLLRGLPDGLNEIYLHPATGPYPDGAPGYRYRDEFQALLDPGIVARCREPGMRLGGFGDFVDARAEPALTTPGSPAVETRQWRP